MVCLGKYAFRINMIPVGHVSEVEQMEKKPRVDLIWLLVFMWLEIESQDRGQWWDIQCQNTKMVPSIS